MDNLVLSTSTQLGQFLGGLQSTYLSNVVKEQLGRLLATLEENEDILGSILVIFFYQRLYSLFHPVCWHNRALLSDETS